MATEILLIPILASFFVTLFLLRGWINKAKQIGLVWTDMNKKDSPPVAGSGGIIPVFGFIIGVFLYIAYRVLYLGSRNAFLIEIFAFLSVVLLLAGVGFVDDLLGWRRGGLPKISRIIMILIASIHLVAINAGRSLINLPFFGLVDLGIIYPLILIPLGIVGTTATFNFLAGFNGVEAGNGIITLSALALVAFFTGNSWLSILALCMIAALAAFLIFNFCPARVFPGDVITYPVGGIIAIMAILGNFEKVAVFFFIPYIAETFLKLRGGLKKHSFGKPTADGSLELKYDKIYSLHHLAIFSLNKFGIKATERAVVYFVWGINILIVILGFLIFKRGIFIGA